MKRTTGLFTLSTIILVSYLVAQQLGWVSASPGPITGIIADAKSARAFEKLISMPVCEDAIEFKVITPFDVRRAYPRRAVSRGVEGRVKAMLRIDERGNVRDVMILENKPVGIFDEAVEREAMRMKYEPAEQACKGTIRERDLMVEFKLDD